MKAYTDNTHRQIAHTRHMKNIEIRRMSGVLKVASIRELRAASFCKTKKTESTTTTITIIIIIIIILHKRLFIIIIIISIIII